MKKIQLLIVALCVFFLSGCIQEKVYLELNDDGSGQVEVLTRYQIQTESSSMPEGFSMKQDKITKAGLIKALNQTGDKFHVKKWDNYQRDGFDYINYAFTFTDYEKIMGAKLIPIDSKITKTNSIWELPLGDNDISHQPTQEVEKMLPMLQGVYAQMIVRMPYSVTLKDGLEGFVEKIDDGTVQFTIDPSQKELFLKAITLSPKVTWDTQSPVSDLDPITLSDFPETIQSSDHEMMSKMMQGMMAEMATQMAQGMEGSFKGEMKVEQIQKDGVKDTAVVQPNSTPFANISFKEGDNKIVLKNGQELMMAIEDVGEDYVIVDFDGMQIRYYSDEIVSINGVSLSH